MNLAAGSAKKGIGYRENGLGAAEKRVAPKRHERGSGPQVPGPCDKTHFDENYQNDEFDKAHGPDQIYELRSKRRIQDGPFESWIKLTNPTNPITPDEADHAN